MTTWSLTQLLNNLHEDIEHRLRTARRSFEHPGTKGNASEKVWLELLQTYLPKRYQAETAHVVDSNGIFSEAIDIVVFDRQYSPFIFYFEGNKIVPAESVYAVFEAKQTMNAQHIGYAQKKIASVRRLHRTSLPIPYANGTYPAKPLSHIIGGLLTFESDWTPCFGKAIHKALVKGNVNYRLDLGCVAAHGHFLLGQTNEKYEFVSEGKPATAFLFKLISLLQLNGTVSMIDVQAYAQWLIK